MGGGGSLGFALPQKCGGWRTVAGTVGANGQAQRLVYEPFGRAEATAVYCASADQRSGSSVSRRADYGARSAGAARDLGAGTRHSRAGQDGFFEDSPNGGSGTVVRPGGNHRSRK